MTLRVGSQVSTCFSHSTLQMSCTPHVSRRVMMDVFLVIYTSDLLVLSRHILVLMAFCDLTCVELVVLSYLLEAVVSLHIQTAFADLGWVESLLKL